ncbi:MAG: energy-coupling factor transporter ATPase [Armatimonadota bacterium]|nr:energy-coupling factor transporter ATPase [Armatimonadota bacterium]MDR5675192.1 energy-coupling factor transporter ATPase [Armatimonadota bacterium]MDR7389759.1 energy-coupling factor transporter ATPase [Armatimonadota bacterium]MDR7390896.1 energy-coupling factor transporter ATPase [Armatimonadota bacterium]MDR7393775.1 energy-coupling factor transporter ATPase [Armatimonadota bacterium]
MSEPVPLIEVHHLTHVYHAGTPQEVRAVHDVSLTVYRGEFLALVGGNGSGKSTLAKHLNALLLPTEGRVVVDGLDTRDPHALWEIRRKVGMVFQNPDNQIVATVVEEDVAFGPENLGLPPEEIAQRVEEALRTVGMLEHRRREPHLLSGGQKQRVAIAGVLAMRPQCIVLDEATTMLDPEGRREVLRTAHRLREQEGIAVVHITHNMEEAAQADRVVVLHEGRVALEGIPREVFRDVQRLRGLRLDLPEVAELSGCLRRRGIPVEGQPLDPEELAAQLLRWCGVVV